MTITLDELDKMIQTADEQGFIVLRIDLTRIEYANLINESDKINLCYRHIPLRIASQGGMVLMKKEDEEKAYNTFRKHAWTLGQHVIHANGEMM